MELPRLVLKFGGTSVGSAEAIRSAADIVKRVSARSPAVVVSAASRVTDTLVALLDAATRGEGEEQLRAVETRYRTLLRELSLDPKLLDELLLDLRNLVRGIELLRDVTPRTSDLVLSFGERLMAPLFAAFLVARGLPAKAWVAGDLGLVTDDRFTRARPLPEAYERIAATLRKSEPHIPVITGYLGRTLEGHTTTLGRGGSDYSGSIVARAVGAEELQIWTDVDGILTADPRIVPSARLIDRISFSEASELAYSGAKVLHPSTITPAMEGGIPVRVLNTHFSDRPGTAILDEKALARDGARRAPLRSIAHKYGVQVVTVVSPRMVARSGFLKRIAEVFDRHQISVDMISTSEISVSFTTDEKTPALQNALADLRAFSSVELEEGMGQVSVVGSGLGENVSLVGDILRAVTDSGGAIDMISFGATHTNLSFLVRHKDVEPVVRALHGKYFEVKP